MNASLDGRFRLHLGDARQMGHLLGQLAEPNNAPLTCTITSPPYGALKDYGHPDQIGWGQPYDEYLVEMRRIFRNLYRFTRQDGSMWVISDTLRADQRSADEPARMEPVPFHLAQEAADAGWILRETLIWQKHKTLPWSSGRRLRNVFEYVQLFVKSANYKFYSDRLRDPDNLEEWWVKWPERYNPNGKVPTNVWNIPIPQQGAWAGSLSKHACPLPPDLVERLVFLSTDPGDIVFDPFAGTGVVVAEAERLGRHGLGIELNRRYVKAYERAIVPEVRKRDADDPIKERMSRAQDLRTRIIKLRAMKYPRVLWQRLYKDGTVPVPEFIVVQAGKITDRTMEDATSPLSVKTVFVYRDEDPESLEAVHRRLKEIASRAPATKFGITGEIVVARVEDLDLHVRRSRLFLYERGRTWDATKQVTRSALPAIASTTTPPPERRGSYPYPPIVGNVEVHETPGERP